MQKERKTLVMRVGKSHEGFMFDTKAPLGSKEFKPKIPSVSEDNYLRKTSGRKYHSQRNSFRILAALYL